MKIFVGYPSENLSEAREIVAFLRRIDQEVWFDKDSLKGGSDWDRAREQGQLEADFIVHLCSPIIKSRAGVVNREIRQSLRLNEDQPLGSNFLLPIRTEAFPLPVDLMKFQYIDYFRDGWEAQLREAVSARLTQLGKAQLQQPRERIELRAERDDLEWISASEIGTRYATSGTYPRYKQTGLRWSLINACTSAFVLESFFSMRSSFRSYELEEDDAGPALDWTMSAQEVYQSESASCLRFTEDSFTGGAHGNQYLTTMNFLEEYGDVDVRSLFCSSDESAVAALRACRIRIAETLGDSASQSMSAYAGGSTTTIEHTWILLSNYSFTPQGLMFSFSPYDLLPWLYGSVQAVLPWATSRAWVDERYQTTIPKKETWEDGSTLIAY